MNVVLYMRYSSEKQTEQSIEGQNHVCTEFCEREGYHIVERYIDRATSAFKDTDKRSEFQRMIRDSEKGLWEAVIVYKLDRFSRNRYDSATYKAKLKKNGVRVISATENISDNPEGVILESVLEGMAEFYSKELSQKITRGMNESAMKCHSVGGRVPLGYRIENKKLVVDPAGAAIVKEAFDLYAAGHTVSEIIETFNKKGYKTTTGAEFNKNSFKSMFKNERYIGVYSYKDIRIEGGVPAIIDSQTWAKVQAKLSVNREAPATAKAKESYLLTNKLFCGHCGDKMIGESGHSSSGKVYNYYTCGNRKKNGNCNKKPIPKDWLERVVVQDALEALTPEFIEAIADAAVREAERIRNDDTRISSAEAELKDINKGISNLVSMIEKGVVSDAVASRLVTLENDKKVIAQRLLEYKHDTIVIEKDHVIWWLTQFKQTNNEGDDNVFRRRVIDLLVNSVTIWDDPEGYYTITTVYNLQENSHTKVVKCSDLKSNAPPL